MSVWVLSAYAVLIRCSLPVPAIGTHRSRGIDSMSMRSSPGSMRMMAMLSERWPPGVPLPSMTPDPLSPLRTPARESEPITRKLRGASSSACARSRSLRPNWLNDHRPQAAPAPAMSASTPSTDTVPSRRRRGQRREVPVLAPDVPAASRWRRRTTRGTSSTPPRGGVASPTGRRRDGGGDRSFTGGAPTPAGPQGAADVGSSRYLPVRNATRQPRADAQVGRMGVDGVQPAAAGLGSRGRPRSFSPTMLRWIWLVPPQIVSEREKKNDDIIGLTG